MEKCSRNKPDWAVDGVFAVCFTGNKARADRLFSELDRVGLNDPYVIWGFPTPYDKFLLRHMPHVRALDEHPGSWGVTRSHYRAIKTAYHLGCNRALFCEDDCRFLADVGLVEEAMRRTPPDYDFLMLDSFYRQGESRTEFEGWSRCTKTDSSGCYICNRRAMEVLIDMYESPISGKYRSPMMRASDNWTNNRIIGPSYNIYFADPNLAVQCKCPGKSNYGDVVFEGYRRQGTDLSNYMPYEVKALDAS